MPAAPPWQVFLFAVSAGQSPVIAGSPQSPESSALGWYWCETELLHAQSRGGQAVSRFCTGKKLCMGATCFHFVLAEGGTVPILCVLHEHWAGCLPFERRTDKLHAAQAVALQALGTGRMTL